ncbi:ribosome small subunit-dependent GTPase A [Fusobacterium perfoetens]|uniref:ribosome small subunit-dependent GTPase A n=1 Tax=Fusobacterium perfoetens TaxID=852 RepID=UPI000485BD2E|nr:ribosome small subunit-dependent GTPase A [Fusobacterium perfoetens]MCI6151937.1 ribosome small subunit-dependent GTPase A [Fusobacterium perfoetens]MDY3238277.1 ribosome small subunit-dependent GTPase A [Fusobacterium perfoetens]
MNKLQDYGVKENYIIEAKSFPEFELGRVIAQYKGMYKVSLENGEKLAELSGKLRYEIDESLKLPLVGDYVLVSKNQGNVIINKILSRKSVFFRSSNEKKDDKQGIVANIDTVFICMSLNENYNLNRLERYLSIAWDSGAIPVIVLTKSDLCESIQEKIKEVESISAFSDIILTSNKENNKEKFKKFLAKNQTVAFIGSSGVGKTTLINELIGEEILLTQEIGKNDKGKHTTTNREMVISLYGGVIIDTPGMREIGVRDINLDKYYDDIEELIKKCRFSDCTHTNEPGCQVRKAIELGTLDKRRVENYFKIKRENSYDGLRGKELEKQKLDHMFKEIGGMKKVRNFIKDKQKRRGY